MLARLMKRTGEVGGLFVLLDETWVIYITRSSQAAATTSDHIHQQLVESLTGPGRGALHGFVTHHNSSSASAVAVVNGHNQLQPLIYFLKGDCNRMYVPAVSSSEFCNSP